MLLEGVLEGDSDGSEEGLMLLEGVLEGFSEHAKQKHAGPGQFGEFTTP